MSDQAHHVRRHTLSATVETELDARRLAPRLEALSTGQMLQAMERAFEAVDLPQVSVQIDRIEIDLGDSSEDDLHRLPERFQHALEAELRRRIAAHTASSTAALGSYDTDDAMTATPLAEHDVDTILAYLLQGTWPDDDLAGDRVLTSSRMARSHPLDLALERLLSAGDAPLARLLRALRTRPDAVERLREQTRKDLVDRLLKIAPLLARDADQTVMSTGGMRERATDGAAPPAPGDAPVEARRGDHLLPRPRRRSERLQRLAVTSDPWSPAALGAGAPDPAVAARDAIGPETTRNDAADDLRLAPTYRPGGGFRPPAPKSQPPSPTTRRSLVSQASPGARAAAADAEGGPIEGPARASDTRAGGAEATAYQMNGFEQSFTAERAIDKERSNGAKASGDANPRTKAAATGPALFDPRRPAVDRLQTLASPSSEGAAWDAQASARAASGEKTTAAQDLATTMAAKAALRRASHRLAGAEPAVSRFRRDAVTSADAVSDAETDSSDVLQGRDAAPQALESETGSLQTVDRLRLARPDDALIEALKKDGVRSDALDLAPSTAARRAGRSQKSVEATPADPFQADHAPAPPADPSGPPPVMGRGEGAASGSASAATVESRDGGADGRRGGRHLRADAGPDRRSGSQDETEDGDARSRAAVVLPTEAGRDEDEDAPIVVAETRRPAAEPSRFERRRTGAAIGPEFQSLDPRHENASPTVQTARLETSPGLNGARWAARSDGSDVLPQSAPSSTSKEAVPSAPPSDRHSPLDPGQIRSPARSGAVRHHGAQPDPAADVACEVPRPRSKDAEVEPYGDAALRAHVGPSSAPGALDPGVLPNAEQAGAAAEAQETGGELPDALAGETSGWSGAAFDRIAASVVWDPEQTRRAATGLDWGQALHAVARHAAGGREAPLAIWARNVPESAIREEAGALWGERAALLLATERWLRAAQPYGGLKAGRLALSRLLARSSALDADGVAVRSFIEGFVGALAQAGVTVELSGLVARAASMAADRGDLTSALHLRRAMAVAAPARGPAGPAPTPGPIHVDNAGVVLIASFLPMLFARLNLLEGEAHRHRLRSRDHAGRGVHFIQHLVYGRLDDPEPALGLNKILCGLDLHDPLPRRIEAQEEETAQCRGLLDAVISYWTAIGQASHEGLQETFLQREGRLTRTADAWRLVVERRTVDVLVDMLPWGMSTVLLPWMPAPLYVEW